MKLLDRINSNDIQLLKLKETILRRPTDEIPIFRTLYQLYNSKNPNGKFHVSNQLLASIVDSCCTQLVTVFLLSRNILVDLLKNNPNLDRISCSGLEYKLFMKEMLDSKILEQIEAPSSYGKSRGKAGKYKILYPEI